MLRLSLMLSLVPLMGFATDEGMALYEKAPSVRKVDFVQSPDAFRVVVRAVGDINCYKNREIERIIEKDFVKIILRLKKAPDESADCVPAPLEYEEKVFECPPEQAPKNVWILGYEGWNKLTWEKK